MASSPPADVETAFTKNVKLCGAGYTVIQFVVESQESSLYFTLPPQFSILFVHGIQNGSLNFVFRTQFLFFKIRPRKSEVRNQGFALKYSSVFGEWLGPVAGAGEGARCHADWGVHAVMRARLVAGGHGTGTARTGASTAQIRHGHGCGGPRAHSRRKAIDDDVDCRGRNASDAFLKAVCSEAVSNLNLSRVTSAGTYLTVSCYKQ